TGRDGGQLSTLPDDLATARYACYHPLQKCNARNGRPRPLRSTTPTTGPTDRATHTGGRKLGAKVEFSAPRRPGGVNATYISASILSLRLNGPFVLTAPRFNSP